MSAIPFASDLRGVKPFRRFERVTAYRVEAKIGVGTEEDPHRYAVAWFTEHGDLIAYKDAWLQAVDPSELWSIPQAAADRSSEDLSPSRETVA